MGGGDGLQVIPLKLFLDIVPSSSVDITRALRACFRGGSVYASFLFVTKQIKTSNHLGDVFFDIFITSKGASALGMFENISEF